MEILERQVYRDNNSNEIQSNEYTKAKQLDSFSADDFVENLLTVGSIVPCDDSNISFERHEIKPAFYNEAKFKRGQLFFHKNIMAMFFSKLLGLVTILSVPSILKMLVFTKMSSDPLAAYRRYLKTLFHMYVWYNNDLAPGSDLWKSLSEVKGRHNSASTKYCNVNHCKISQKDMALTQFGFMGYAISRSKRIGIHESNEEDWEGFLHFWKVIGYLLGVEDRFNICRDSVSETKQICELLINRVFKPEYAKKDPQFIEMSSALIKGMWCMQPFLHVGVTLAYIYERLILCKTNNEDSLKSYSSSFTKFEIFYLKFMISSMSSVKYNILRIIYNLLQYLALWLMVHCPFLAYYKFGKENSHVRILQSDL